MRFCKIILLVFITTFAIRLPAQKQSFGAGVSSSLLLSWNPGFATTPYLFYRYNNHELLAGPDLYGGALGFGSIIGGEVEYRYHFFNYGKHSNLFAQCNFQYVRFANGLALAVPFSYHYFDAPGMGYSMIQMRCFDNTAGIGIQDSFWKICSLYFNSGIGFAHYRNNITPGALAAIVDQDYIGSKFKFTYTFKIGLSIKIISKKTS
jgi:hypothetical protein